MKRVVLLTTLWRRHALERFVLGYYRDWELPGIELLRVAVGSEGKASKGRAIDNGWTYVEAANCPLSMKHQAGFDAVRELDPDYVVLINSDDLLSKNYFAAVTGACAPDDVLALADLWFLDLRSSLVALGYFPGYRQTKVKGVRSGVFERDNLTLGAGRCFGRVALDEVDWQLWVEDIDRGLDGSCADRLLAAAGKQIQAHSMSELGVFAMDVKSGVNLWNFKDYKYGSVLRGGAVESVLASHGMAGILRISDCGFRNELCGDGT